ncbi:MAG: uracil-DNA glycosylase [Firmicutes bacterium]|nr:uracil-DNA glycosylase [Bacillota bacterium]
MAESGFADFAEWAAALRQCRRCRLCETRTQVVAGEEREKPLIFMLGEAPGGREDQEGRPFCGQAGGILDDFLRLAGLKREEVYISNVVKCRPTRPSKSGIYGNYANRKPTPDEIRTCAPWLEAELAILAPKLVVTLGGVPLSYVLGKNGAVGQYHGQPFFWEKLRVWVYPLYHPAALIYDASKKTAYEQDVKKLGLMCRAMFDTAEGQSSSQEKNDENCSLCRDL